MDVKPTLKRKLELGAKGKAILFAGSGCSIDCINYENSELPTANPLLKVINKQLTNEVSRLDIAASMLYDQNPSEYLNLINDTFFVKGVPDDLIDIMSYDWDRVYTTNYDNALETAAQKSGKKARAIIPEDLPENQPKGNLQIVHLHGYIERFNLENIQRSCILDYNSNIANSVYDGPWANFFRNDISTADVVVFIGYSLYDPEIAKLIRAAEYTKEKVYFVNSSRGNPEISYMQKQFGTSLDIEREGFSKVLMSAQKQAGKKQRESFVCFERGHYGNPGPIEVTRKDLHDLFMFGKYNATKALADAVNSKESYVIARDLVQSVLNKLDNGSNFISVYSPLGHGKTIFTRSLTAALQASGKSVFRATRNQPEFRDEVQHILENYSNPIFIFDDFFRYTNQWEILSALDGQQVSIIATARVNVFTNREDEIEQRFLNHSPEVIKLEELSVKEGRSLVPLITQAGLWQESANLTDTKKLGKIRSKSKGGFHNNFADILIGLMESADIVSRFRKELNTLKEISVKCYEGVLLTIYIEFSNNDPDITLLQEGFGSDLKEFLNNTDTEELLRIFLIPDSHGIRYHSSVFSKYVLENACNPDDVIKVIRKTVVRLATSPEISNDYKKLLADLMRFNYLKSLCSDNNFDRTWDFYEKLSAYPEITRDDLFWNAFGMCERARHNFGDARKHFYTSISYAKNRGQRYVPYHAQNQLIVCILEAGIQVNISPQKAHADLLECIRLLLVQADDERAHGTGQAFSWHRQLGEFSDKYIPQFEESKKAAVRSHLMRYSNFIRTNVLNWERRSVAPKMIAVVDRIVASIVLT